MILILFFTPTSGCAVYDIRCRSRYLTSVWRKRNDIYGDRLAPGHQVEASNALILDQSIANTDLSGLIVVFSVYAKFGLAQIIRRF